jgi:Na(+)-translocating NADH:ubiquinone oxidoreductase A subunit
MEKLRTKGGLSAHWEGWPEGEIDGVETPSRLVFPLTQGRFEFTELRVADGDKVVAGQVLAVAPEGYHTPLLAPLGGTIEAIQGKKAPETIIINDLDERAAERDLILDPPDHAEADTEWARQRQRLMQGGAWPLIRTYPREIKPSIIPGGADTTCDNGIADPMAQPGGVLITCLKTDIFKPRGHVLLEDNVQEFCLGLEVLQRALGGYEPIYLVVSEQDAEIGDEIREHCRGHAWLQIHSVKTVYPFDHPAVVLQGLGLRPTFDKPFWCLTAESVLAAHRVLVTERPVLSRVVTVAGPGVKSPRHVRVYSGTPVKDILADRIDEDCKHPRVIVSGMMSGWEADVENDALGLLDDSLTVVPAGDERPMLGFLRPGFRDHSVTQTFLSSFLPLVPKRVNTRTDGERRACIQCQACAKYCPIDYLMPYLLFRYLGQEMIEEMEKAGIWECIECGICSYVCPSKIPLLEEIRKGKELILEDLAEMMED